MRARRDNSRHSYCAIGYEAAAGVLRGFEEFSREYENHIVSRECTAGIGQTLPCATLCPAHVDIPAYIACVAAGDYAGAIKTSWPATCRLPNRTKTFARPWAA